MQTFFDLFLSPSYILYIDCNNVTVYILNNKKIEKRKNQEMSLRRYIQMWVSASLNLSDQIHASIYSYFRHNSNKLGYLASMTAGCCKEEIKSTEVAPCPQSSSTL